MLSFPQLSSGTLAQYPLRRRIKTRTLVSRMPGGREIRSHDARAGSLRWRLQFTGLSGAEAAAIDNLFRQAEGRLRPFTWLDPCGNLLSWSEDFSAAPWIRDPFLQLTPGQADPLGGTAATTVSNGGQIAQRLEQNLPAPGAYVYNLSVWIRSAAAVPVALSLGTASRSAGKAHIAGPEWRRVSAYARLEAPENEMRFAFSVPAGASAELFGAQAEAQPEPGGYVRTTAASGVHSSARFDQDLLVMEADGAESFAASITITAGLAG